MSMSPEQRGGRTQKSRSWSVIEGALEPSLLPLNPEALADLSVHIRNSGPTVKTYMSVLLALEMVNPEVMRDESQRVRIENDLIKVINYLNPDDYNSAKLAELRKIVSHFEESPPPAIQALEAIFEALETEYSDKTSDIKARAYGTIRALYLIQNRQGILLPVPLKES